MPPNCSFLLATLSTEPNLLFGKTRIKFTYEFFINERVSYKNDAGSLVLKYKIQTKLVNIYSESVPSKYYSVLGEDPISFNKDLTCLGQRKALFI